MKHHRVLPPWGLSRISFLDEVPDRIVTLLSHVLELDSVPPRGAPNYRSEHINDRFRDG